MNEFDKILKQAKDELKELITDGSSKEQAEKVAQIDKLIDGLSAENTKTAEKYDKLKTDYIDIIKNTSFKARTDPSDDDITGHSEKSFEDCLAEAHEKFKKEK